MINNNNNIETRNLIKFVDNNYYNEKIQSNDENYKLHILKNKIILDVRSPGEFIKGHIPGSLNIPILNDEERRLVGIEYKLKGSNAAVILGNKLISGQRKDDLILNWKNLIEEIGKENLSLICARGGNRSAFAQNWINEFLGIQIPRFEGGYKYFRHYLIKMLLPENIITPSLVLSGNTGSGKTILLNKIHNAIDLEAIANHRGSAFGSKINEQPSQACFENTLAFEMIKMQEMNFKYIVFESESKSIGKVQIPDNFFTYMHSGPYIFLEASIKQRVDFTYNDYIENDLKLYKERFGNIEGHSKWAENILFKISKIKKKLGHKRFNECISVFNEAENLGNKELHKKWIEILLCEYYDPMYEHHRSKWCNKIIKSGSHEEIFEYLNI